MKKLCMLSSLLIFCTQLSCYAAGPNGVSSIRYDEIDAAFSLILASDPQYPWMAKDNYRGKDAETVLESGIHTNRQHIKTMNTLADAKLQKPLAAIINGDLTAFGHPWQWDLFKKYYYNQAKHPDDVTLNYPIFPGLGNHDYANNVNDCWGGFGNWIRLYGSNGCAINSIQFIAEFVDANPNVIKNFDAESMSYSWDMGNYHFVQLHNYPTYEREEIDIENSIDWLKDDLEEARQDGKRIVLNFHDFGEHMKMSNSEFRQAIADHDIVAIFVGHIHSSVGEISVRPNLLANKKIVPVFRCGSAAWNHFLHVTFHDDHIMVSIIDSATGKPVIRHQKRYD